MGCSINAWAICTLRELQGTAEACFRLLAPPLPPLPPRKGRLPHVPREPFPHLFQLTITRRRLAFQPRDLGLERLPRRVALGLHLFQFADLDLRGKQRGRALLERRPGARQFRRGRPRLHFRPQRLEFRLRGRGRARPQRRDQFPVVSRKSAGRSGCSTRTRLFSRSSAQNSPSTAAGVPMLPRFTNW
ncbi:hypothetical protein OKW29_001799 [Paraburkholderia sp. CI3]